MWGRGVIILAIDPGTQCGWAIRDESGITQGGVWNLKGSRFEGAGMRFLRLERMFTTALSLASPDVVVLEEVRRHKGTDAAHIYGGIIAVIAKECEKRDIPYFAIPVGTIKKNATGRGNASKDDMMDAAHEMWPDDVIVSEDACDARWIAEAAWREVGS